MPSTDRRPGGLACTTTVGSDRLSRPGLARCPLHRCRHGERPQRADHRPETDRDRVTFAEPPPRSVGRAARTGAACAAGKAARRPRKTAVGRRHACDAKQAGVVIGYRRSCGSRGAPMVPGCVPADRHLRGRSGDAQVTMPALRRRSLAAVWPQTVRPDPVRPSMERHAQGPLTRGNGTTRHGAIPGGVERTVLKPLQERSWRGFESHALRFDQAKRRSRPLMGAAILCSLATPWPRTSSYSADGSLFGRGGRSAMTSPWPGRALPGAQIGTDPV
jgi:hypothetical protein